MHFKLKHCPNLHHILVACYGAQNRRGFFRAPEIIADADFFALAITLNVARICIDRRDRPSNTTLSSTTTVPIDSPLRLLWNNVYRSIQNDDYAFWGDAIAEQTKNITRELIYKVARSNIAELLNSEKAKFIAASLVSRMEVLVKKRDISEPTLWDDEWNKRWNETWSGSQPNFGLRFDSNDSNKSFKLKIDGRAAGEIAGRTPTRTLIPEHKILFNTIIEGIHSQGGVERFNGMTSKAAGENTDPGVQSQNETFWASPREVAVELAWEEAWDIAVFQGSSAARTILRREQLTSEPRITNSLDNVLQNTNSPRTSGKIGVKAVFQKISAKASRKPSASLKQSHPRPHPPSITVYSSLGITPLSPPAQSNPDHEKVFQWSIQERQYLEKKEESRLKAKLEVKNLRYELSSMIKSKPGNGSEDAWISLNPGSLIRPKLEELADRELKSFLAHVGNTDLSESSPRANDWKKKFIETWEKAWKKSWDAAWDAVWEETWDAAVARGVEFGAELILDDPACDLKRGKYEELQKDQSYTQIKSILKQDTCLGILEQVRVMMRELYIFYELLHHSVSDSRHDHLEILVGTQPNRDKKPSKSARKNNEQDPSNSVSYPELQQWVEKYLINPKFGGSLNMDTHAKKLFKRGISRAWSSMFDAESEDISFSIPGKNHY
ncbi:hypothetical protein RSOLAG22IIIB_09338 [Rhizoctonia solani]|uniref:Uncharacterized protein n=1 Tax=Rhizoctonia solani TaxID=456999 RepID=A0A0K6FYA5_9AGAM|nr:hypothetical protein RSOLAG22IIIB_09338 [Rhizoctonia solani]